MEELGEETICPKGYLKKKSEITLPASIRMLSEACLEGYDRVKLKRNKVAGLFLSMSWMKDVILEDEEGQEYLLQKINSTQRSRLNSVWLTGDKELFWRAYTDIPESLCKTKREDDALEFLLFLYGKHPAKYQKYEEKLGAAAKNIALRFLETGKKSEFLKLLQAGLLPKESLDEILTKLSQGEKDATLIAYVLEKKKELDGGKDKYVSLKL